MMTSSQIAQANHHAFSMGYGPNAGVGGYESITGFTPFGHGSGSQFGTGALTGANSFVGTASMVGMGSYFAGLGLNKLFPASRLAAGLTGIGAATGMTLPMAATFGAMIPAQLALSGMASGAQQLGQVQNMMDNNFGSRINMGGRFGFGVGRQDALNMTEAIRSLKSVPEMMTSMGELQNVLGKVSQMGILQGVRSATEFKTKFTSMVGALREISKNLGSTLEETLPFLQSSVRQGFLDPQEIQRNVQLGVSGTSVGIGMSRQRMFGLQEQGANLVRQMGGDSRVGSMGARDVATSISVAQNMGVLSQQDITRLTGKVGEEGVADLSQRFMSAQARLFQQKGAGRFITAALAERNEEGIFTGRLDQGMLKKLRSNQLGGDELMKMGMKNLSGMSDEQAISFENAMARGMGAEAGSLAGMSGGATAMNAILERMGADNTQAKRRILQSITGMSQAEADAMLKLADNAANVQRKRNAEMVEAATRDRSVAFFKENMTLSGKMHHMGTSLQSTFVDPFTSYGANVATRMGERYDDVMDQFITGSGATKANMLLNPLEIAKNVGYTLFGNRSTYRSTQDRLKGTLGSMLTGNNSVASGMENLDITKGFQEKGLSNTIGEGLTNLGLAGGASATGAAASAGMLGGGLIAKTTGFLLGGPITAGVLATGAIASTLNSAYSGYDEDEMRNIFGGVRSINQLNSAMSKRYGSKEAKGRLKVLMEKLKGSGVTAGNLSNTSLSDLLDIAESMGGEGMSGLSAISAAAQGGGMEGELAAEIRDRISSSLIGKAIGGGEQFESVLDAQKRAEDIFDPGGFDKFVGGMLSHEAGTAFGDTKTYFASGTAKSLFGGSKEQREALLKILGNEKLRSSLSTFSGRRSSIERLAKDNNLGAISTDDLMALSQDLNKAYTESGFSRGFGSTADDYFDDVFKELTKANNTLSAEDERMARSAMLSTFTQGFADKGLGRQIADLMTSQGGIGKNIGTINELLSGDVKGRVAKQLKEALGANNLVGVKDQKGVISKLKSIYSEDQIKGLGIFDDDNMLSDRERDLASKILGASNVLDANLTANTSEIARRSNKMGMDVEGIRDQAFKEALEAQSRTLIAHTDFVRTVGETVPALKRASETTAIINAGEIR